MNTAKMSAISSGGRSWLLRAALFVLILALGGCSVVREPLPLPDEQNYPRRSTGFPPPKCEVESPASQDFVPLDGREPILKSARLDLRSQGLDSWARLENPLRMSLEYVRNMPQGDVALRKHGMSLTWGQVRHSIEELLAILPRLDREPELLGERFVWYGVRPDPTMTGYFTPEIEASLKRYGPYQYPIYGVPEDLHWGLNKDGRPVYYRLKNGRAVRYYTRRDIDMEGALSGRGLEIAWAKNPVDIFYLQVEGCGRLRLPDGSVRNVLYGAKNGLRFKSLGRILYDHGRLPRHKLSKGHVKAFFRKHPKNMYRFMAKNPSYVFFRLADAPPEGAMGKPLTPMVSLATDRNLLPLGSVLAFETEIPDLKPGKLRPEGRRKVYGIGLAQDTGSAIRGSRVDYYIGEGNRVEAVANRIKTRANIYLLVSKEALNNG